MCNVNEMLARRIKLATRRLLGGFHNLKEAAGWCRVEVSHLSNYQTIGHSSFMPLDVAMALQEATNTSHITHLFQTADDERGISAELPPSVQEALLEYEDLTNTVFSAVNMALKPDSPGGREITESEIRIIVDAMIEADRGKANLMAHIANPEYSQAAAE